MVVPMVSPLSASTLGMLFGSSSSSSGGVDFSLVTGGAAASGAANIGSVKSALASAEKNEAKQLAQAAKDPQVQKDLARYEKVVKNAKTIDDVLNDPIARKVLMTAAGLKGDINNIGLAKKAMLSDPKDSSSVAVKMSSINGAWLDFAKTFDLAKYGLDRLSPQMDGMAGRWKVSFERQGEPIEAMLQVSKVRGGGYTATVDGTQVPITVNGDSVTVDMIWRDDADELHTTRLVGALKNGALAGVQYDDGVKQADAFSAKPYFADALKEVSDNYVAEKRLDMLDAQLPGLGSAVLFKSVAKNLKNAVDILGSPLGREVVTTAFNIPKQIAIQSMAAQEKAINQRVDASKFQNDHFVDQIAQRYLIMLNGGLGGVTA
jgi:hypothetical protein